MAHMNHDSKFDYYKKYYPDKWVAISVLRRETGMDFSEANDVINQLFGMTDDDERMKDDAEQEKIYQAQLTQAEEAKVAGKKRARKAGVIAGVGLWATIKTILGMTKKYK